MTSGLSAKVTPWMAAEDLRLNSDGWERSHGFTIETYGAHTRATIGLPASLPTLDDPLPWGIEGGLSLALRHDLSHENQRIPTTPSLNQAWSIP